MTCADRRDLLMVLAADPELLEADERSALRAHLASGCPVCAGAWAEAQAVVAEMSQATTPIAPPPTALIRLMARVQSSPTSSSAQTIPVPSPMKIAAAPRTSVRRLITSSLLAAAAAVAITSSIFMYATRDARAFWRSRDVAAVALADPNKGAARAQLLWDAEHDRFRISIVGLSAPPDGREYELWFIPPGNGAAPVRSVTFTVDADGNARLTGKAPPPFLSGPVAVAAITDEPLGGTDAPTGQIRLAGSFPN